MTTTLSNDVFRYVFTPNTRIEAIEDTLLLAIAACESLHSTAEMRLTVGYALDRAKKRCVIDATTPTGRDLNRLFTGLASRELGPNAFMVERVSGTEREVDGVE
jgi:hypothetical protein